MGVLAKGVWIIEVALALCVAFEIRYLSVDNEMVQLTMDHTEIIALSVDTHVCWLIAIQTCPLSIALYTCTINLLPAAHELRCEVCASASYSVLGFPTTSSCSTFTNSQLTQWHQMPHLVIMILYEIHWCVCTSSCGR